MLEINFFLKYANNQNRVLSYLKYFPYYFKETKKNIWKYLLNDFLGQKGIENIFLEEIV